MGFWLHTAAARHPERVALAGPERSVTYSALATLAVDGARALQAQGVRGGDRVALELEDRFAFAVALHACLLRAAVAVPIDLRLGESERAARRAGAVAVVGEGLGQKPGVLFPTTAPAADAVATVMHTSGTTGAPKPVELTYGNWEANAIGSALALGLDLDERWLCAMPLAHVGGLSILIRSVIYATTVVLHERFQTDAVVGALMDPEQRITLVSLVPTMLARLLDAGLREPPTLRWVLLGGGPLPAPLLARAARAGVPVAPTYGMTETCSQIATFGQPLHGAEIHLQGPDQEIVVRGPMVAPRALAADGWLHTGDLAVHDACGRVQIIGRKTDTIITGGENVSPAEVEAVLLEHPSVADAGIFARSDPEWGEAVVASVVLRPGADAGVEELQAFCAGRLAAFKVPKAIEFTESLPRTDSGKLLRGRLG